MFVNKDYLLCRLKRDQTSSLDGTTIKIDEILDICRRRNQIKISSSI